MKVVFACLLLLIAAAQAADWANLKPNTRVMPTFRRAPVISGRIVGGEQATEGQFKYQLAIVDEGGKFCGASLIANGVVLTAGHCVSGGISWDIHAGALNFPDVSEAGRVIVNSRDGFAHEDFDDVTLENDIAIIFVRDAMTGPNIGTVRLPSRSQAADQFVGATARVSGWGKPSDSASPINPDLKFVDVSIMDNAECKTFFGDLITSKIMCIDTNGGTVSPCNGDSGGPLVITESDGLPTEVGIVSFGAGCESGAPAGFTRVTEYLDWIETNAGVTIRP